MTSFNGRCCKYTTANQIKIFNIFMLFIVINSSAMVVRKETTCVCDFFQEIATFQGCLNYPGVASFSPKLRRILGWV